MPSRPVAWGRLPEEIEAAGLGGRRIPRALGHRCGTMASMGGPAEFYDELASTYHHLYPDWQAALQEQGQALHEVLGRYQGPGPHMILDAAVGVGTQLLGLAAHGHTVVGSDISSAAVRRARTECAVREVVAALTLADMRMLPFGDGSFDAVICADNAVAHLMSTRDVTAALLEMRRVTRPGGHVVLSTRDYEQARQVHPSGTLPQISRHTGSLTVTFQVWEWLSDGERYDLQHFQVAQDQDDWVVARRTSRLWAISRRELTECARRAGLKHVDWLLPEESGFFQPLLIGRAQPGRHDVHADP